MQSYCRQLYDRDKTFYHRPARTLRWQRSHRRPRWHCSPTRGCLRQRRDDEAKGSEREGKKGLAPIGKMKSVPMQRRAKVALSVRQHISGTTRPNFTKFSVHDASGCYSIPVWRYITLCRHRLLEMTMGQSPFPPFPFCLPSPFPIPAFPLYIPSHFPFPPLLPTPFNYSSFPFMSLPSVPP